MTIDTVFNQYDSGQLNRRQLLQALVGIPAAAVFGTGQRESANGMFPARNFNHVTLSVSDLARSRDFYVKLLGATPVSNSPLTPSSMSHDMRIGDTVLGLSKRHSTPGRIDHFCIGVDQEFATVEALAKAKAAGLQTVPPPAGVAQVSQTGRVWIMIQDPDGIHVQIDRENLFRR